MSRQQPTRAQRRNLEILSKILVETCFRNSELENLHAGVTPSSATGDYSDVKVVTPYGEIPWTHLSRISDEEMKALMIDVVDRTYTFLRFTEELTRLGGASRWLRPRLHPGLMRAVRRRRAHSRGAA